MSTTTDFNLQELVSALQGIEDADGKRVAPLLSHDLLKLLQEGVHHSHLPDSLHPSAAEMFQLAAEAIGGLPRLILWADRNPAAFYKLFARQTIPTIAPVLPQPEQRTMDQWPPWVTARRLAYQEASVISEDIKNQQNPNPNHNQEDSDGVGGE